MTVKTPAPSLERVVWTPYGFDWHDHTGKVLFEIMRACSSRSGDRNRWAVLSIRTPTETIDIDVRPRKTIVTRKPRK